MFKYLWIIIVAIVEIVWIVAAIKEFSKNSEFSGDFEYDKYTATLLWVTIHGLIIFTTSLTVFITEGR